MESVYMKTQPRWPLVVVGVAGWLLAIAGWGFGLTRPNTPPSLPEPEPTAAAVPELEPPSEGIEITESEPVRAVEDADCDEDFYRERVDQLEQRLELSRQELASVRAESRQYQRGLEDAVKQLNVLNRRPMTVVNTSPQPTQRRSSNSKEMVFAHVRNVSTNSFGSWVVEGWVHNPNNEDVGGELVVKLVDLESNSTVASEIQLLEIGQLSERDFVVDLGMVTQRNVTAEATFYAN